MDGKKLLMYKKNKGAIIKKIINPSLNLSKDYAEIGLDKLLDEGLLKEIPVIKTLVAIIKTGIAVRERFLIKKFLVFLEEFKSDNIEKKILEKFKKDFGEDEKFRNKTTEQILVIIEGLDSIKKAKILAHLFSAYLKKLIDWKRFVSLASCLKSLQEITFDYLEILSRENFNFTLGSSRKVSEINTILKENDKKFDQFSTYELEALFMASGIGFRNGTLFMITKLGQDLYKYGISPIL
jgi:hypothetical protein